MAGPLDGDLDLIPPRHDIFLAVGWGLDVMFCRRQNTVPRAYGHRHAYYQAVPHTRDRGWRNEAGKEAKQYERGLVGDEEQDERRAEAYLYLWEKPVEHSRESSAWMSVKFHGPVQDTYYLGLVRPTKTDCDGPGIPH